MIFVQHLQYTPEHSVDFDFPDDIMETRMTKVQKDRRYIF